MASSSNSNSNSNSNSSAAGGNDRGSSGGGGGSAIDQILAGSGIRTGMCSQRRRQGQSQSQSRTSSGQGGGSTKPTQQQQQSRQQHASTPTSARGRGSSGGAKKPRTTHQVTPANTGSRRARALQQLAAKRSRKGAPTTTTAASIGSSNSGGASAAAGTTPRTGGGGSGGGGSSGSGRRRVSLGTTPLAGSAGARARAAYATTTPQTNTSRHGVGGGDDDDGRAAVTPMVGAGMTPTATRTTAAAAQWQGSDRVCVRLPVPSSSFSSSSAAAARVAGTLHLQITSRVDRAGVPVPVEPEQDQEWSVENDDEEEEEQQQQQGRAVELRPVRLVPLQQGRDTNAGTGAGGAAGSLPPALLPFLFHDVDKVDTDFGGPNMNDRNDDLSIWDDVRDRGDRCTVVQANGAAAAAATGGNHACPTSSRDEAHSTPSSNETTVPLSMATVNVLLLGMDAGILLRRSGGATRSGVSEGEEDDDDDRCRAAASARYCLYQPTSVAGGDLFVVPDAAPNTSTTRTTESASRSSSTAHSFTERAAASATPTDGGLAREQTSDRDARMSATRDGVTTTNDVGASHGLEVPRRPSQVGEVGDRMSASAEPTKAKDDIARSPSPPTPLQPIVLSDLAEAYENCIGESGDPSPSDVVGDLLPRYLASEEVVAAKASSSLASVYDLLRSEGMLPSKDKIVFEVRDGLAATDRREGLVRLVSVEVMMRLGLLAHGGDAYLNWYQNTFGEEVDGDTSAAKRAKKKRKKTKKSSSQSASTLTSAEFFQEQITELLSCVQFALPTTQTFSGFLNEVIASPFAGTLSDITVRALFDYFEVDVPDVEVTDGDKDYESRSDAAATVDTVPKNIAPLQSEAKSGVAFPLLEESLKREIDDEHNKEEEPEEAKHPDSPLFQRGSVNLARKSRNPLLANGKRTYIGSHFSNKLTNMSDLFREVEVPVASAQSMSSNKKERLGETTAGTKDLTEPSSRSLKKRSVPSSSPNDAAGDTSVLSKAPSSDSKKERSRPFAAATRSSSESSVGPNTHNGTVRNIVKETPMKPSRRSRIFGTGSIVPETPARQPQRHAAHLVAEVSALAAARTKKPRHR